ncbi:N-acetyltransferase [Pseudomonas lopnurensis]|uniref:N-acetyltransferase n=1 Tax=Pseudomonas lopnurensis TaxID=1477517 RepID=UPI001F21C879|nr:N-acetyltransferase [Pseudomonas lopnurensis]
MTDRQASIRHDAAQQRYELLVEGQPFGVAVYSEQGEQSAGWASAHPTVLASGAGKGVAVFCPADAAMRAGVGPYRQRLLVPIDNGPHCSP